MRFLTTVPYWDNSKAHPAGTVLDWPADAKPSRTFLPMDKAAQAALKARGVEAEIVCGAPVVEEPLPEPQTIAEAAAPVADKVAEAPAFSVRKKGRDL